MKNSYFFLFTALFPLGITSCQWAQKTWKKPRDHSQEQWTRYTNNTDEPAKAISARYGREYNLAGNTIAEYPDFNIRLSATKRKGSKTLCIYEVSSKDGHDKTTIECSSAQPDRQHIYLSGMHFYYHSNAPGRLNIYFPPSLTASSSVSNKPL